MKLFISVLIVVLGVSGLNAQDVVIYGGTPGGIAAAISAARMGNSVALVEYHNHIGGMTTSGLGKSDIENRAMIGGLFKEFVAGVREHYIATYGAEHENTKLCNDGYYAEPHVAEKVFESMLARQAKITALKGWRLTSAIVQADALQSIHIVNRHANCHHHVRRQRRLQQFVRTKADPYPTFGDWQVGDAGLITVGKTLSGRIGRCSKP